jgi:hypothetical protein
MTEGALLIPNHVIHAGAGNIIVPSGKTLTSEIHGTQTETFMMTS